MRFEGVNANIMSLGGITVGAMVDAANVLVRSKYIFRQARPWEKGMKLWLLASQLYSVRAPPHLVDALAAGWSASGKNDLPGEIRHLECDLLRNEAAERETNKIDVLQSERADHRDHVPGDPRGGRFRLRWPRSRARPDPRWNDLTTDHILRRVDSLPDLDELRDAPRSHDGL